MIRVEKRIEVSNSWIILMYLSACIVGFLLTSLLLWFSGADISKAFYALYKGSMSNQKTIFNSLSKATPLILTGLATVVAFRAQVWSIGQEGQVYSGAMSAYMASLMFYGMPVWIYLSLIIAFGALGGALLGALSAVLKNRFNVNEIISTVMLNYIIIFFLSYMVGGGPWTGVGDQALIYSQSNPIDDTAKLPFLFESKKLHFGFVLAIVSVLICHVLINHTPFGYEIRAMGYNSVALRYRGTNTKRTLLYLMLLSGAIAGLAGVSEIFGTNHSLRGDTLVGLGFTGIIVGMIGGLTPIGTLVAGVVFGGLASGSVYMKIIAKVPGTLVPTMEGIFLLTFLIAGVASHYKIVGFKKNV